MALPSSLPFSLPGPFTPTGDIDNLGFEIAGATPGSAFLWTITVVNAAEDVLTWGTAEPPLDEDSFESEWDNDDYLFVFELADIPPALFDEDISDGEGVEDYEEGWSGNQAYLFELGSTNDALFDTPTEPFEDFEEDWDDNENYDFTLGTSTAASFDAALTPEAFEDYEDGWRGTGAGNDYDLTLGASTAASWNAALALAVENFEITYLERFVTVDPSSDLFTSSTTHGLSAGNRVSFRLSGAGALPAGVTPGFSYHVIASGLTTTEFKVSLSSGGSSIPVTDAGSGTFLVAADPTLAWIIPAAP